MLATDVCDRSVAWVLRRELLPAERRVALRHTTAVLAGDVIIGVAHAIGGDGAPRASTRIMSDAGPLLMAHAKPLELGGDPDMTVSFRRPDVETFQAKCREVLSKKPTRNPPPTMREVFAEPDERRIHPLFADAYTDIAVFGDHPDEPGAIAAIRRERPALTMRRHPIDKPTVVYVRGTDGWVTADVMPMVPGPSIGIRIENGAAVSVGCCGGPVVDDRGELVGVLAVGTTGDGAYRGALAQLCLALPGWILERLTASSTDVRKAI